MCNELSNDELAIEATIESTQFVGITSDEVSEITSAVAQYVANLSMLATLPSEERDVLRRRRHVLEHFCAAIISTASELISNEHEARTIELGKQFKSENDEGFEAAAKTVQAEFNIFQHNVRVGHNKIVTGIIQSVDNSDVLEFIDVYAQAQTQLVMAHHRQHAMEQLSSAMSDGEGGDVMSRLLASAGAGEPTTTH